MFQQFTERARRSLALAHAESSALGHHLGAEHVLLGLAREGEGIAAQALRSAGIEAEALRAALVERRPPLPPVSAAAALSTLGIDLGAVVERAEATFGPGALGPPVELPAFSPGSKEVLRAAFVAASALGQTTIDTEHLLLALVEGRSAVGGDPLDEEPEDDPVAALLAASGTAPAAIAANVRRLVDIARLVTEDPVVAERTAEARALDAAVARLPEDARATASEVLRTTTGAAVAAASEAALRVDPADLDGIRACFAGVPAAVDAARHDLAQHHLGVPLSRLEAAAADPRAALAEAAMARLTTEMGAAAPPALLQVLGRARRLREQTAAAWARVALAQAGAEVEAALDALAAEADLAGPGG